MFGLVDTQQLAGVVDLHCRWSRCCWPSLSCSSSAGVQSWLWTSWRDSSCRYCIL